MLRHRVLSAIIAIPLLILAIWFEAPWFTLLVSLVAVLAYRELSSMPSRPIWAGVPILGGLWMLALILNAHFVNDYSSNTVLMGVASAIAGSAIVFSLVGATLQRQGASEEGVNPWAWHAFGVVYLGLLACFWVLLMNTQGREWVFLALFGTFAVDTTAYFVGRAWGRRKLAPSVSPGKTWEGAAGGLLGGTAGCVLLSFLLGLDMPYWQAAVLGMLLAVAAQIGDLVESKLKRISGVKEAGGLIPGHGGMLDRLDSILLTGVVVYYWAYYLA